MIKRDLGPALYDDEPAYFNADETEGAADRAALQDRRATGCQYDTGLCACPAAPFQFEGCRARRHGDRPGVQVIVR